MLLADDGVKWKTARIESRKRGKEIEEGRNRMNEREVRGSDQ